MALFAGPEKALIQVKGFRRLQGNPVCGAGASLKPGNLDRAAFKHVLKGTWILHQTIPYRSKDTFLHAKGSAPIHDIIHVFAIKVIHKPGAGRGKDWLANSVLATGPKIRVITRFQNAHGCRLIWITWQEG